MFSKHLNEFCAGLVAFTFILLVGEGILYTYNTMRDLPAPANVAFTVATPVAPVAPVTTTEARGEPAVTFPEAHPVATDTAGSGDGDAAKATHVTLKPAKHRHAKK